MADPMKIRATMAGDKVDVKDPHEPRDGDRPAQGREGRDLPAWFIQNVTATHNGKTVLSAEWGPRSRRIPSSSFKFAGGKPGDKVTITWTDNHGDKRTDEATIS